MALNHFYWKGQLKETTQGASYATDDGTTSGSKALAVNGSVTPVTFWLPVAAGEIMQVFQVVVTIIDNGTPGFGDFGNITNGLTNGLQVFYDKKSVTVNGSVYKNNEGLLSESDSHNTVNYSGNNEAHVFRDNMMSHSNGILLYGDDGDRIGIVVQDDLTSVTHLNCFYKYHIRTVD